MKKWLALLLILCMGVVITACTAPASQTAARKPTATATPKPTATPVPCSSGDYMYILLENNTACISQYKGNESDLSIPVQLDGHTVSAIGDYAFFSCSSLTSITIPNSVTSIGNEAFARCSSLTSITIPDSVTSIGANPFAYCMKLTNIQVSPNHPVLATIDGNLFYKPEKRLVTYLYSNTSTSYTIPDGILSIGDYAFAGCYSLTSITIPDSVTSIGE